MPRYVIQSLSLEIILKSSAKAGEIGFRNSVVEDI